MLSPEEVQKDVVEISAARCPECHTALNALNNCEECSFRNLSASKFCGGCGKPVDPRPTKEGIRLHAEQHWGKDFDKSTLNEQHKSCETCKSNPDHAWQHGIAYDATVFPDIVRRWDMLMSFQESHAVKVVHAGAALMANPAVEGEGKSV